MSTLTPEDVGLCRQMRATCACDRLRRTARAITQVYEAVVTPSGLKATQMPILVGLGMAGEVPLTMLAAALGLDRTTLTRNVKLLEDRGLVTSFAHGDDARVRILSLTEEGSRTLSAALAEWEGVQDKVEAAFGEERLRALLAELDALSAAIAVHT
ncbi:MAG TPA: MarR family winged helix-turn-helix transcriptional regulator [Solirubrobacteraceae bacterium]|nr:MarR family winged helix-turn-helix transcriptional regulator [Solirubrobacteraceae bacterium]